jgi:hypothetical protein
MILERLQCNPSQEFGAREGKDFQLLLKATNLSPVENVWVGRDYF